MPYKHGMCSRKSPSPEYRAWSSMKSRCTNKNARAFKDYGQRGISVCPQWVNDFVVFLNDVGKKPSPEHQLERVNNDGNYEPGNVVWATRKEQQNNRRNSIFVTIDGKRIPFQDACAIVGVKPKTAWMRIARGMSTDAAIQKGKSRKYQKGKSRKHKRCG